MELKLQQFIASVEQLSEIRNLDQFNPIFFQMQHPTSATMYTIIGSKVTPSYMGVPINVVWVVLDPTSQYYHMALKLRDVQDIDTITNLPAEANGTAWWHVVRTYDGIWENPQYYINITQGPKGDKGDKGDPGEQGLPGVFDADAFLQRAFMMLAALPGTLTITGPDQVAAGSQTGYQVFLDQQEFVGNTFEMVHSEVFPHLGFVGAAPANVSMSPTNNLIVGAISQDSTVRLTATYPSWTRMLIAFKDVLIKSAVPVSIKITGNNPIYAGKSETLVATVTFSDGTTARVNPTWSVDDTSIGTINTAGLITGQLSITQDSTVNVTATYSTGNGVLTDTAPVQVKKLVLVSLTVIGATSVQGTSTATYTARAAYNSGDTKMVTASWSVNNALASINSSGVLTPVNQSGVVRVTAAYTDAYGTATGYLDVTITAVIAQIAPFYGTGPALPADWSTFVNALAYRGTPGSLDASVNIDAIGTSTYMYWASPKSLGLAQFFDVFSNFYGGWGGAGNSGQGPSNATINNGGSDTPVEANVMINGTSVPFYIWRTDYPNMGPASGNKWTVSPAP